MLSFRYPNKMLVSDERCGRRSCLPPCSDGITVCAAAFLEEVVNHLGTRLTLGSGDKGSEVLYLL
jgi:hypothetical protein